MIGLNRISIKSKLQIMLLTVSLCSIMVVGYLGWSWARAALKETIFNQLTSVRSSKASQVESYFNNLRNHVETLCEDRMVVEAMMEFNQAFKELDSQSIPPDWDIATANYYKNEFFPRLSKTITGEPNFTTYRPISTAARYLQYQYIAKNPYPVGKKDQLVTGGDESNYSKVHSKYHAIFRNLIKKFGYYDLFLIDIKSNDIVYTVYKETDFGINLEQGINRDSNLAKVVEAVRKNPDRGAIQIVDFQLYRPSYMAPAAFIAAPIYNQSNLVGILAIQLPVDQINNVLTGNGNWKRDGLGNTGETYMVGADLLMRSLSRFLIEDSQGYKSLLKSTGTELRNIQLINQLNTSIILQKINTEAARDATKGIAGTKIVEDYQNKTVLSSYSPLKIEGLNWGIIAQMDLSEAYQPIYKLQRYFLIATAILSLIIAYLANIVVGKFVKPIAVMIEFSRQSDPEPSPDFKAILQSPAELGQLAHIIRNMTQEKQKQTEFLAQKERENEALLLNMLPSTVVERIKKGETKIADRIQQVTVMVATIFGVTQLAEERDVAEVADLFNQAIDALDEAAERFDVEKLKIVGDRYIAVCGLTKQRLEHTKGMMDFALEATNILQQFNNRHGVWFSFGAGIHTGAVMGGIIGKKKFSYELWGETWTIANQLHEQTQTNRIRISQAVYDQIHEFYAFEKDQDIRVDKKGKLPTWVMKKGGLQDLIEQISVGIDNDDWG
ncbi:adenylate/guanylate cyclase domain-containing protein [Limnofasciculus baicalensis]|uniref:Adenylate/guanylate cyclase domain-containing protein n=1 Tax=Limnofasciculus baicalensis BBK-W-15 TaxID=2699891 RepID=A0AAE3KKY7_9CYAN|nr:adenylate/guanylate cyclase domain-containing protein [Limnofasciculus baicalensis]MCP2727514.1 adenylate/guanylate cyclase domain-containing protein [Limnofasciculus baicalensis BBK-W-15]